MVFKYFREIIWTISYSRSIQFLKQIRQVISEEKNIRIVSPQQIMSQATFLYHFKKVNFLYLNIKTKMFIMYLTTKYSQKSTKLPNVWVVQNNLKSENKLSSNFKYKRIKAV